MRSGLPYKGRHGISDVGNRFRLLASGGKKAGYKQ